MRYLLVVCLLISSASFIAQNSFTICAGSPITITATNPASLTNTAYSISPGTATNTTGNFVVSPTITTTYTLYTAGLTSGNTPSFTTAQVTVNVYPFSQFFYSVSGTPTLGCSSKSVAVMNVGINNASAMSYTISGPLGAQQPSYNATTNSLTIFFTVPGQWTTTVLQPSTGCTTKLALSIMSNTFAPPLNLSIPSSVIDCTNTSIVLSSQASSLNIQTTWTGPTGPVNSASILVNGNSSATTTFIASYSVTLLDLDNLCQASTVIAIYQNKALPNVLIAPPVKTLSCLQPTLTLVNISTSGALPPFQPNLPVIVSSVIGATTTLNPGNAFVVSAAGTYTVNVYDLNNGCENSGTVLVGSNMQYPQFLPTQAAYNLCSNSTVTLSPGLVQGTAAFQWNFPQGAASQVQADGSIVATTPGVYSVTATNSLGCSTSTVFNVVYCVGVSELNLNTSFQVYPNPFSNPLLITTTEKTSYAVYSLEGKQIFCGEIAEGVQAVPTSELSAGLYLLKLLSSSGEMKTLKIAKRD